MVIVPFELYILRKRPQRGSESAADPGDLDEEGGEIGRMRRLRHKARGAMMPVTLEV